VLWVIALVGAARVLLLSSAFPLFNNVDEYSHFDAVYQYSRGRLPHPDRLHHDARASGLIIWLGSPEYVVRPSRYPDGIYPAPSWSVSPEAASIRENEGVRRLTGVKNHELAQPPVYYALGAGWYRAGEALGLSCGNLAFSIRWLNALFMAGMVWAAHRLACATGRRDSLTRIGVPLLVALFPQDAFYSISNDALSPLVTALALLAILRMHAGQPRSSVSLVAGLLTASAILTKYTNCVVLIPAVALTGMNLWKPELRPRGWLRRGVLFWFSALAPLVAWGARNAALLGDPTAMGVILESQGYRPKPLGALLDHPLFSSPGLLHFLDALCADFWRGRFMWHGEFMAHAWADAIYVATTGIFLTAATVAIAGGIVRWHRSREREPASELRTDAAAWLAVTGAVALLGLLSLQFHFPERLPVPSRDNPYFTNARLISGFILPFALLYVRGLGAVTSWISERARASVRAALFGLVVATIAISEIWLSELPARSAYNWFHLVSAEQGGCAPTPRWPSGASPPPGGQALRPLAREMRDWQDPAMPRNDAADDR
jgi:hypothetical protein